MDKMLTGMPPTKTRTQIKFEEYLQKKVREQRRVDDLNSIADTTMCVDEIDCHRLTKKLMMCSIGSRTDESITKLELMNFSTEVLRKVMPNRKFDRVAFEKGYHKLDPEKQGYVTYDKVMVLVETHFKSIGLLTAEPCSPFKQISKRYL